MAKIKNDYFQCEICHKWYKIFHYSNHMALTDDPMHKQKDKKSNDEDLT